MISSVSGAAHRRCCWRRRFCGISTSEWRRAGFRPGAL